MKVIDVYEQYFKGSCEYNTVPRKGAQVKLTATSEEGTIRYEVSVNFFPHEDETDFRISYDAFFVKELYFAKGRRSKKKEAVFMEELQKEADLLAEENGGEIYWDEPLIEARLG